jgi:hypothetical protein
VHPTQTPVVVSQTVVAPVHLLAFVAEHWPHAPDSWQAGAAAPHSPSPAQLRHAPEPTSQTGVVPEHSEFVVHAGTHDPDTVSHTGLGNAQSV